MTGEQVRLIRQGEQAIATLKAQQQTDDSELAVLMATKRNVSAWRAATFFGTSTTTAAVVGKHNAGVVVGQPVSSPLYSQGMVPSYADLGSEFLLKGMSMTRGGAADPTSTGRFSVYEATLAPSASGATGVVVTLVAEVAGSGADIVLTPRGVVSDYSIGPFALDPSKRYVYVMEVIGAALPASVLWVFSGLLLVRGA